MNEIERAFYNTGAKQARMIYPAWLLHLYFAGFAINDRITRRYQ